MKVRQTIDREYPGLAEKIVEARKASDKTLTELAALAGMSYANWYRIERGDTKVVPLETVLAMQEALGVDLGIRATHD